MTNLEALLIYCTEQNRVCPQPRLWQQFWESLPGKRRLGGRWQPDVPYVLGGWGYTDDEAKRQRLFEHIQWASDHGAISSADASYGVWKRATGTTDALELDG